MCAQDLGPGSTPWSYSTDRKDTEPKKWTSYPYCYQGRSLLTKFLGYYFTYFFTKFDIYRPPRNR